MRARGKASLTDRERILTKILLAISYESRSAMTFARRRRERPEQIPEGAHLADFGHRPTVGDVVLCESSGVHPWTVGIVREVSSESDMLIQEISGPRTCWVRNEMFTAIVNLDRRPGILLWGREREFERRVKRAFAKGDEYLYRFGWVEFQPAGTARVFVREAFGGIGVDISTGSVPFAVEFAAGWHRLSQKAILKALRAAGYGTRKFEREPLTPKAPKA